MEFLPAFDSHELPKEMRKAIRIINERYRERLREEDVAEAVEWTKSHFSRRFRGCTGMTYRQYLTWVRLYHACRLLRERDLSVTAIALEVGMGTLRNLEEHFLDMRGMSPSEYRRRFAGCEGSC